VVCISAELHVHCKPVVKFFVHCTFQITCMHYCLLGCHIYSYNAQLVPLEGSQQH